MPPTSTRPQLGPRRARGVEQGYHINKANKIVKNKGRRLASVPPVGVGPGGAQPGPGSWPGGTRPGPGAWPGATWTSPTGAPTTTPTMTEPVFPPSQTGLGLVNQLMNPWLEQYPNIMAYMPEHMRNPNYLAQQTPEWIENAVKFYRNPAMDRAERAMASGSSMLNLLG